MMNVDGEDRRSRKTRRRLKSSVVLDPNGSRSTFRRFYQSGGRDYEQYRIWLQTQAKSHSFPMGSMNSTRVKSEPTETGVQRAEQSIAQESSFPTRTHPVRTLSIPVHSRLPLPSSTRLFHAPPTADQTPLVSTNYLPPLAHWSTSDVAQFIESHFSDKNMAQKFIQQKIDGRTLPLLTEDHLTRVFKMKLGPALRLLALMANVQLQQQPSKPCTNVIGS